MDTIQFEGVKIFSKGLKMKKMRWVLYIFLICLFGCVLYLVITYIIIALTDFHHQQEIDAGNSLRCHVFTEQIKEGMTLEEVENILGQYGKYWENRSDFSPGVFQVKITYSDKEIWHRFGSDIYIEFVNSQYHGAWLPRGLGEEGPVCKP